MALDKLKRISLAEYVIIAVSVSAIISLFSYTCLVMLHREVYPEMGDMISKLVAGAFAPLMFNGWKKKEGHLLNTIDYFLAGIVVLMIFLVVSYQVLNWLGRPNPHQLVLLIDKILVAAFAGTNFRDFKNNKEEN